MGLSYKTDVLTTLIADCVSSRGRGAQTRLAEAVGVEVQTVNKWVHGQTHPTPDRWPAIEAFFDMEPGEIASRVVPRDGGETTAEVVARLAEQVDALVGRLQALERSIEEATQRTTRRK